MLKTISIFTLFFSVFYNILALTYRLQLTHSSQFIMIFVWRDTQTYIIETFKCLRALHNMNNKNQTLDTLIKPNYCSHMFCAKVPQYLRAETQLYK